jgi:hypothetical protein
VDHSQPHTFNQHRFPAPSLVLQLAALSVLSSLVSAPLADSQTLKPAANSPAVCPVQFIRFNPSGVSVRLRNISGKPIVGLVFNAAIADAAEHWFWLHWYFDVNRPIREFGWNKVIKADAAKTLSWDRADVDFEHGGGGAFVLTSVLFEDGSSWEESKDNASCKYIWYNGHKKTLVRPVQLPFRE